MHTECRYCHYFKFGKCLNDEIIEPIDLQSKFEELFDSWIFKDRLAMWIRDSTGNKISSESAESIANFISDYVSEELESVENNLNEGLTIKRPEDFHCKHFF